MSGDIIPIGSGGRGVLEVRGPYLPDGRTVETGDEAKIAEQGETGAEVRFWLGELHGALRIEERFRREAEDAEMLYYGDEKTAFTDSVERTSSDVNMFHAAIDTLRPVLYSGDPTPIIERRFRGDGEQDPADRYAAEVAQRLALYSIQRHHFGRAIRQALHEYMVPGRGVVRVTYEADIEDADPFLPPRVMGEAVYIRYWRYRDFLIGPATSWDDVPWIGYRHYMTRNDVEELTGDPGLARALKYSIAPVSDSDRDRAERDVWNAGLDEEDEQPETQHTSARTMVYELWDKSQRRVLWIAPCYKNAVLLEEEDPFGLEGFFDCPCPMLATTTGDTLTPRPDATYHRDRLRKMARLDRRQDKLIEAVRVVGIYPGAKSAKLEKAFSGPDLALIPVDQFAAWAESGGLNGMISWLPIEQFVRAAQVMSQEKALEKQQYYEETGISDILRGASDPTETATAQRIKGHYAGVRVRERQRIVDDFVADAVRMIVELSCETLSTETMARIANIDLPQTEAQREAMAMAKGAGDPRLAHWVDPGASWESVRRVLSDDMQRGFSLSIETDRSLTESEDADAEARVAFLSTLANLVQQLMPIMQGGVVPASVLKALLLFGVRGFRKARTLESLIEGLPDAAPQPGPTAEQMAADLKKLEIETKAELERAKLQLDARERVADRQADLTIAQMRYGADQGRVAMQSQDRALDREDRRQERQDARAERISSQIYQGGGA